MQINSKLMEKIFQSWLTFIFKNPKIGLYYKTMQISNLNTFIMKDYKIKLDTKIFSKIYH